MKDYYQCSVTSVPLYQLHTWPSAFWGRMFYDHMLALFSAQAPGWQSKQSHLGDSKHRRQEVWWRNSRPLSIHYLSEINKSFLWPTWRKIRTAFTIDSSICRRNNGASPQLTLWYWYRSQNRTSLDGVNVLYVTPVDITRNILIFCLKELTQEMYLN